MTALVDDITELLILYPHLAAALERDAGTAEGERVSGKADPAFGLPVNADVLGALVALHGEVHALAHWAAGVVAEVPLSRDVDVHLRHMPRYHERMLVTAAVDEAAHLAAALHGLLRTVKLSLGLRTADRHLGQYCPMHDDPLRELIVRGDEGRLRLDRAGRPVGVDWTRSNVAECLSCRASWGPGQLLSLRRLLAEADARRVATVGQGAA